MKFFFWRTRLKHLKIDPDEVLLDAHNLPDFDVHQFEGRLERPIPRQTFLMAMIFFAIIGMAFAGRTWILQVRKGEAYSIQSERNRLHHSLLFAERGVIYDRNGVELAWNIPSIKNDEISERRYLSLSGLGHILGYIKYPTKDSSGFYFQENFEGIDGIEKYYNKELGGTNGLKITETDALGQIKSESLLTPPKDGESLTLSIDSNLEHKLYETIKLTALDFGFEGGGGVILDIKNGEVLALASFPEYDPNVLTSGGDSGAISSLTNNPHNPFLNRVTSGLYTPGSIVKPFLAVGALEEKVIDPSAKILSTGSISIPNPYFPDQKSVFKDWKAHGWVDVRHAIAISSNVYFYEIGGGFENQKGLGIGGIDHYADMFGLGRETGIDLPGEQSGVIPSPEWKERNFPGDSWRIGDTYNTAIGQYGFQITPLQEARGIAAIANNGIATAPTMIKDKQNPKEVLPFDPRNLEIAKEGMRLSVTEGTASGLNISDIHIAAKTGTAELGSLKQYVNSWVTGFFPYENPRYAFAVIMEKGPRQNTIGGVYVMRQLFEWMRGQTPEYLK